MDMTRRAALMTSAAIASSVLFPMRSFGQETPRKGGVFTVHYGAEQRQLNPSLQASTGVYEIAIAGVTYTGGDFITVATFLGGATGSLASGASGGSLRITSKDVAGTLDNAGFSFVVYRTG